MKKLLLISILIASSFSQLLNAQTLNLVDAKGFKQGLWKNYSVDTFSIGVMHVSRPGEAVKNTDVKHSYVVRFILISEGYYLNNKKEKVWRFYDKRDTYDCKNVTSMEKYKGDSIKFETSHCVGKITKEISYRNDTIDGYYKSYYGNRNIKSVIQFSNGNVSDSVSCFYESGKLMFSGNLIKGTGYFQVTEYYESGGKRGIKKVTVDYIRNEWINK